MAASYALLLRDIFRDPPPGRTPGDITRRINDQTVTESPRASTADDPVITAIRAGDRVTFDALVSQYFAMLSRCAYVVLQSRDAAEDVAQEVLADLWTRHERFQPAGSIRAYLLTAVRHRALNRVRREHTERKYTGVIIPNTITESDTASHGDEAVSHAELAAVLEHALQQLPDRTRHAVLLRYEVECSFPEIAAMLGVSLPAAQKLVQRALVRLRELLTIKP